MDALRRTFILDLDGVVWRGDEPVPGSPEAIVRLHRSGARVLYLTNNSNPRVVDLTEKLERFGVAAAAGDVVTSARAAAGMLEPGTTALVCGGPGITEALDARGVKAVTGGDADAVVVGFSRDFDYERLTSAFLAVHHGARLIGTNDDPVYPTSHGPVPGGGALLAAVATAAGVTPEVAGKPNTPMADELHARLGDVGSGGIVLVGDRPSTDGLMARRLGVPFLLVLSGVTTAEDDAAQAMGVVPEVVSPDLASLVDHELA